MDSTIVKEARATALTFLRIFGLVIPLAITRTGLYLTTTISSSIFVLLPLSIITYHKYYTTLIPLANSPIIPLNFKFEPHQLPSYENATMVPSYPFSHHSSTSSSLYLSNLISPQFPNYEFDESSPYIFKIRLSIQCPSTFYASLSSLPPPQPPQSLASPSSSYQSSLETPPLLSKIQYTLQNPSVFKQGTFILNCDPMTLYQSKNSIVPYNLRFWTPPKLSNLEQSTIIEFGSFEIMGDKLQDSKNFQDFVLVLNHAANYIIEDGSTQVWFEIKWTGFRFYLVKYYYLFYVVGTLGFFLVSLAVSVLTGYGMLWMNYRNSTAKTKSVPMKAEPRVKIERTY
ncbi:uncharacterized protein LODBEIA_P32970 [Lodderomyces beijingensis]|uniref:Seipin n=1 Tax=Lodderomyces beijingensis TaxID=1775926 RepID=A0ABP0ZLN3_9ASCO